jgi:hypothetical protein
MSPAAIQEPNKAFNEVSCLATQTSIRRRNILTFGVLAESHRSGVRGLLREA